MCADNIICIVTGTTKDQSRHSFTTYKRLAWPAGQADPKGQDTVNRWMIPRAAGEWLLPDPGQTRYIVIPATNKSPASLAQKLISEGSSPHHSIARE